MIEEEKKDEEGGEDDNSHAMGSKNAPELNNKNIAFVRINNEHEENKQKKKSKRMSKSAPAQGSPPMITNSLDERRNKLTEPDCDDVL